MSADSERSYAPPERVPCRPHDHGCIAVRALKEHATVTCLGVHHAAAPRRPNHDGSRSLQMCLGLPEQAAISILHGWQTGSVWQNVTPTILQ